MRTAVPFAVLTLAGLATGCQIQAGFTTGWRDAPAGPVMVEADGNSPTGEAILFTWYADNGTEASQMCYAQPDGRVSAWRDVFEAGRDDRRRRDLTPEQAAAVRRALSRMPPSQDFRAASVVIVDFRAPGQRDLGPPRYYDRGRLPEAVADLFAATGAPLDPVTPEGSHYPPDEGWTAVPAVRE